jgi:hypothetical protein
MVNILIQYALSVALITVLVQPYPDDNFARNRTKRHNPKSNPPNQAQPGQQIVPTGTRHQTSPVSSRTATRPVSASSRSGGTTRTQLPNSNSQTINPISSGTPAEPATAVQIITPQSADSTCPSDVAEFRYKGTEKRCKVLFNEILPTLFHGGQRRNVHQFIEVAKRCGTRAQNPTSNKLQGYMILIASLVEHATQSPAGASIIFIGDFLKNEFKIVTPESGRNVYLYVLGSRGSTTRFDQEFWNYPGSQHTKTNDRDQVNAIPAVGDSPTAILLLYFPTKDRSEMKSLKLTAKTYLNSEYEPLFINEQISSIIKSRVVDVFIYGKKCTEEDRRKLSKFIPELPESCGDFLLT